MKTTIDLAAPPSVNRVWRTTRTGKMYCDPKYASWRKSAWWEIVAQRPGKYPAGTELAVTIRLGPMKRLKDTDNCAKAAFDALQAAGTIANDRDVSDLRIVRDSAIKPGRIQIELRTITEVAA